jgi:predicted alpha/beta superfamily hydrolase
LKIEESGKMTSHKGTEPSLSTKKIISSKITGQDYEVRIYLPHSYPYYPDQNYPVVYVMDGNLFGEMVAGIARLMAFSHKYPEVIVTSVGYPLTLYGEGFKKLITLRGLEFTPSPDPEFEEEHKKWLGIEDFRTGNARLFRRFLLDELAPVIETEYRVRPDDRTLLGHSASGLFTLYAMFRQPEAFQRYIVGSPPLRYANGLMFRIEGDYAAEHNALPARLFLGIGSEEELLQPKLDAMVSVSAFYQFSAILGSRNYAGFHFENKVFEGFDHLSVPATLFSAGLRSVFLE